MTKLDGRKEERRGHEGLDDSSFLVLELLLVGLMVPSRPRRQLSRWVEVAKEENRGAGRREVRDGRKW